jgi:hypothetical protein
MMEKTAPKERNKRVSSCSNNDLFILMAFLPSNDYGGNNFSEIPLLKMIEILTKEANIYAHLSPLT